MRRILLIIAFIIVVIGIGVLIYFMFFRDVFAPTNGNVNTGTNGVLPISNGNINRIVTNTTINGFPNVNGGTGTNTNTSTLPDTVARGGVTVTKAVTDTPALSPTIATDGSIVYYDPLTGKFYRVSADGSTKTELSDRVFPQASEVEWSPSKTSAIITFPDQSKVLFDFATGRQTTLPKEWDDVVFSPDGAQVAYKFLSNDENDRWLAIANPDGTNVQGIEPLGGNERDVQVAWAPNNQVVALYHENSGTSSEEIYPIGLHGENFASFKTEGRGFEGQWSPSGERLLYTTYSGSSNFNPVLSIVDARGDAIGVNNQQLNVQTWVDKCAFSNTTTLYCAIPENLPEGAGIYRELADTLPDTFWRIDLATGLKTPVAIPVTELGTGTVTAKNVFISPDGTYLYFTNVSSGRVTRLQIK